MSVTSKSSRLWRRLESGKTRWESVSNRKLESSYQNDRRKRAGLSLAKPIRPSSRE